MTKEYINALKQIAADKYSAYLESEKWLWEKAAENSIKFLYKNFKRARAAFHAANHEWETALLQYFSDFRTTD